MESNYPAEKSRDFRGRWAGVNRREQALAPRAGFEPATNRLTAGCSTAELPGNSSSRARNAYNKAGRALKAAMRRKSRWVCLGFAWPAFAYASAGNLGFAARAKVGGHA